MSGRQADYETFLARKAISAPNVGLKKIPPLHKALFPHQRDCVEFALRLGRAALFLDTGLGKSLCELEWCRRAAQETGKPALILTPLAVGRQFIAEAKRFDIPASLVTDVPLTSDRVWITNYERLHRIETSQLGAIALDESSILKAYTGKTKRHLVAAFVNTPFRLCATATPAPNDHVELGNHSEFLGIMPAPEMLTRWFIIDTDHARTFRIKKHARIAFWDWIASWARCAAMPSDLGYDDIGFDLPPLKFHRHIVETNLDLPPKEGDLFYLPKAGATEIHKEKRLTAEARAAKIAEAVAAQPNETWLLWCDTNAESAALAAAIPNSIELLGSQPERRKEQILDDFATGEITRLISKPTLTGFGLNWQHCSRHAFIGLSYSFEAFYQAIRRSWRFGQRREVEVHIAISPGERATFSAVSAKASQHEAMKAEMRNAMIRARSQESELRVPYRPRPVGQLPDWITAT